jgi:hypothetical protein
MVLIVVSKVSTRGLVSIGCGAFFFFMLGVCHVGKGNVLEINKTFLFFRHEDPSHFHFNNGNIREHTVG